MYSAAKIQLYKPVKYLTFHDKPRQSMVNYFETKDCKSFALAEFCETIGLKFNTSKSFFGSKSNISIPDDGKYNIDTKIALLNHIKKCHVLINVLNYSPSELFDETKSLIGKLLEDKIYNEYDTKYKNREEHLNDLSNRFLAILSLRNYGKFFENHNNYGRSAKLLKEALKKSIPLEKRADIKTRKEIKAELIESGLPNLSNLSFNQIAKKYKNDQISKDYVSKIYDSYRDYLNIRSAEYQRQYQNDIEYQHKDQKNYIFGVEDRECAKAYAKKMLKKELDLLENFKITINNKLI